LTIKFTQHTAASRWAVSYQLSALSSQQNHHTPRKPYGAPACSSHAYPIARISYTSRL
jgi:hypothetical protein